MGNFWIWVTSCGVPSWFFLLFVCLFYHILLPICFFLYVLWLLPHISRQLYVLLPCLQWKIIIIPYFLGDSFFYIFPAIIIKLYETFEYEFILYDYTAESKVLTLAFFLMLWLFVLMALILILNYYSKVIDWLDLYLTV